MRRRIVWICITGLMSLLAFMSQVGPDEAVSNLSKWYGKVSTPPEWIQRPELDTIWTVAFLALAVLSIVAYFIPSREPIFRRKPKPQSAPLGALSPETREALGIDKPSRYAHPPDAKEIDIRTATYKELGELCESTGHDVRKFERSVPYNASPETIISQFHKKVAPLILWVYEEARRRGHRDNTLEHFYSDPSAVNPQSIQWLGKSLITLGSRLTLYIDQ
jgi:hypothetical protein